MCMKFLQCPLFWVILLLFFSSNSYSQKKTLPLSFKFTRINHEKGLLNANINDILQDSVGFVWIATNDGLYKYDGLNCKSYRQTENQQNSIPNNHVQSLFLDEKNQLWIMTDNGLCVFNYQKNAFTIYSNGISEKYVSNKSITSMDQFADGTLAIGTYGNGIDLYNSNDFLDFSEQMKIDSSGLDYSFISKINIQGDSILWAGTWNDGLYKVSLKTKQVHYISESLNKRFESLSINDIFISKNYVFVGSNQGLLVFSLQGKLLYTVDERNSNFIDHDILSIYEDSKNTIWVGTRNSGLYRAETAFNTGASFHLFTNFRPSEYEDGISHRTISTIYEDRQGNIWLGTHNGGVNVFNPNGEAVTTYKHKPMDELSLSHQSVWGICEDHNGHLWIGSDGGGVNFLNPFINEIRVLKHKPYNSNSLSDNAVLSANEDIHGNLWFGTYIGGLNKYDPQKKHFTVFNHESSKKNNLAVNDVRVIQENKTNGHIWIGTNSGGLYRYNPATDQINGIIKTQGMDIRAISFDEQGNLWLGTFGLGLIKYHPEIDLLSYTDNWYSGDNQNTPIILSIAQTNDYLWLATRNSGLVRFHKKNETFKIFSETYGLANSNVRAVVAEDDQNIWLSTNVGISMFDVQQETFINFDASNGFTHGHFNDGSGLLSKNGYLAFGSIHGLNLFYPDRLLEHTALPSVVISDISVLNESITDQEISTKTPLNKNIALANVIKLKHMQNIITFRFTALDMPLSNEWEYQYKLENYDENWNIVGKENIATYRNLPSGEYEFKVQVAGTEITDIAPVKSIHVDIAFPWWRTIYAYIAYFAIIVAILIIIYKVQMREAKLKNSLYYEKKLRQQEHDIMDEKIRFYTNFSHELKTPLTLILGPVYDLLRKSNAKDGGTNLLKIIQKNADLLLSLINRLLEFRKIESEKIILHCAKYDINALGSEEFEYFQFQANKKGVTLVFKNSGPEFIYFDHEKIQIVLNNLLSNAIKFTEKGQKILFKIKRIEEEVIISVRDNGIGIDQKELKSIFNPFYQANNSLGKGGTGIGLALCKNLVELHGGSITAKSKINKGAKFEVKLPTSDHFLKSQDYVQFNEPLIITNHNPMEVPLELPVYNIESAKGHIAEKTPVILVVDDNADIVHYLETIFEKDFKVVASYDGMQGVEYAVDLIPDIIISDVMMPHKDGIELCQELKSNQATSHIPIILLTAKDTSEAKIDGFGHGADAYIVKPFNSSVLKSRVTNLLENRKTLARLFSKPDSDKKENKESAFMIAVEQKIFELLECGKDNVPNLAQEMGFSRTSLYRKIKAVSGMSINKFIRHVKIQKAAELLKSENINVSEVAYSLGFDDLKYFRKCFKEQFSVSPSEYSEDNLVA